MRISLKDCILIKTHFFDYAPDTSRQLLEGGPQDDSAEVNACCRGGKEYSNTQRTSSNAIESQERAMSRLRQQGGEGWFHNESKKSESSLISPLLGNTCDDHCISEDASDSPYAVRYNSNQNVDGGEQEGFGKAMHHDQKSDESASSTQR
ncbi:hypothetical protein ARMSODRAFT_976392 [Armillaria solidipes]|uniref:Uncharacterized protein n=1 Tax=Armillaria solidipes TaxID=1076256 RepID=A0A2H3BW53_9AGAR|nr:hypothetical protein ARMSODRAFT_976392 [Armillaria solidipes]